MEEPCPLCGNPTNEQNSTLRPGKDGTLVRVHKDCALNAALEVLFKKYPDFASIDESLGVKLFELFKDQDNVIVTYVLAHYMGYRLAVESDEHLQAWGREFMLLVERHAKCTRQVMGYQRGKEEGPPC